MGTIVVGVDGRSTVDQGLVWALRRASWSGAEVVAVMAWQPAVYGADATSGAVAVAPSSLEEAAHARLATTVSAAAAYTRESGVTLTSRLELGPAAVVLDRVSRTADMVVLTCRHVTATSRLLHGSVTSALLHHATCPVIVLPEADPTSVRAPDRVVVANDFTPAAQYACDWASDEAAALGVPLMPVFVRPPLAEPQDLGVSAEERDRDIVLRLNAMAPAGKDVRPRVLVGPPGDELVRMTGPADLLVVGSRGRGDVTGWLLGSTSASVVRHARCPVVVARELSPTSQS
jgi:nucleotide-binding universal stress UspA family protein